MQPVNDCIIVQPLPDSQQEGKGVRTPESALFLGKARVVSIGNGMCVLSGQVVTKAQIIPNIEVGQTVYYWKEAENKMTEDAIFRTKASDTEYYLILPIKYIRAIE